MNTNKPIGIFDSGVGGSSIWQEIHKILPFENTVYLADSKNAPYGNKSSEEILQLSIKNTEMLLSLDCKVIVVACNTATTNAIFQLRKLFSVPIIGIEPAIKPAALLTTTKKIGVLATKGTLSSALFSKTNKEFTQHIEVVEVIGEGLVNLIEKGNIHSSEMYILLQEYTKPMIEANIDYLVLGCTHFPYLIPQLEELLPKRIQIIHSGEAVARQTKHILQDHDLQRLEKSKPSLQFYSNNNTNTLKFLLKEYSKEIKVLKKDF